MLFLLEGASERPCSRRRRPAWRSEGQVLAIYRFEGRIGDRVAEMASVLSPKVGSHSGPAVQK